jgi:hypothetical protein
VLTKVWFRKVLLSTTDRSNFITLNGWKKGFSLSPTKFGIVAKVLLFKAALLLLLCCME